MMVWRLYKLFHLKCPIARRLSLYFFIVGKAFFNRLQIQFSLSDYHQHHKGYNFDQTFSNKGILNRVQTHGNLLMSYKKVQIAMVSRLLFRILIFGIGTPIQSGSTCVSKRLLFSPSILRPFRRSLRAKDVVSKPAFSINGEVATIRLRERMKIFMAVCMLPWTLGSRIRNSP